MKPIYIIAGVLVVILLIVLMGGKAQAATPGTATGAGLPGLPGTPGSPSTGSGLADAVNQIVNSEPPPDSKTCRKNCDSLCKPCPTNANPFKAGPRRQCELDCRAECIKGSPYKTMYPNC